MKVIEKQGERPGTGLECIEQRGAECLLLFRGRRQQAEQGSEMLQKHRWLVVCAAASQPAPVFVHVDGAGCHQCRLAVTEGAGQQGQTVA